jgi:hypothetical protein
MSGLQTYLGWEGYRTEFGLIGTLRFCQSPTHNGAGWGNPNNGAMNHQMATDENDQYQFPKKIIKNGRFA